MAKLATRNEAETILRFQGATDVYRRGINSLAGVFDCGVDAELAASYLKEEGYKAHAVTDLENGTGICVVGIHG
jgi:hypothetical protein